MVSRRPLVTEDGLVSELLQGDTVQTGGSSNEVIAGSGLVGGGVIGPNTRLDFAVAVNPSGVIYAGDSIGNDGVSFVNATTALSSGNAALTDAVDALASGNAALSIGTAALASGNAALDLVPTLGGGANTTVIEASSSVASGIPVGVDDTGRVRSIESFTNLVSPAFQTGASWQNMSTAAWGGTNAYPKLVRNGNSDNWAFIDREGPNAYMDAECFTWNGSSLTSSTPTTIRSANTQDVAQDYNAASDAICQVYTNYGAGSATRIHSWYFSSSTTITPVDVQALQVSNYAQRNFVISSTTNNQCLYGYSIFSPGVTMGAVDIDTSTRLMTLGGTLTSSFTGFSACRGFHAGGIDKYIVVANEGSSVVASVFTISGTGAGSSLSQGTEYGVGTPNGSGHIQFSLMKIGDNGDHVVLFKDASNNMIARYGTVSGTTITYAAGQVVMNMGTDTFMDVAYLPSDRAAVQLLQQGNDAQTNTLYVDASNSVSVASGVTCTLALNTQTYVVPLNTAGTVGIAGNYGNTNTYAAVVDGGASAGLNPTLNSQSNALGVAQSTVSSGTDCTVVLPGSVYNDPNAPYTPGKFYYVDPTTSGFTESSAAPASWSGAVPWNYLGKAVTTSGLLLINSL